MASTKASSCASEPPASWTTRPSATANGPLKPAPRARRSPRASVGASSPPMAGAARRSARTRRADRGRSGYRRPRIDAARLDQSARCVTASSRLRAEFELDRDAGIEMHAVEHPLERFRAWRRGRSQRRRSRRRTPASARSRRFPVRAAPARWRRRIGMIDALHDLPGCAGARPATGAASARADRAARCAGRRRSCSTSCLERRALQHAVDQLAPLRLGGRREIRRERQVVRRSAVMSRACLACRMRCQRIVDRRKSAARQAERLCGQLARRQPFDAGRRRRLASASRDARAGDHAVRRDLGQRHQHEGALEQPRMRQGQAPACRALTSS